MERADLLIETGEVTVSGRMDPEKLCSLLHGVTKKYVEIVTQSTQSEGHTASSQQNKNVYGQVRRFSVGENGNISYDATNS